MNAAPLVLGFDTSGPWCSAVLLQGDVVLADLHEEMPKGQGEMLFPRLEALLASANVDWSDLTAIGVGIGPGNFTGIRISVSAARGLAQSLGIPAVGVSLLEAAAHGTLGPVLSCMSAPRDQAYLQGCHTTQEIPPQLVSIAEIPMSYAEAGVICIGTAAAAVAEHLGTQTAPAPFAPGSAVARLAAQRWMQCDTPPAPLYLKPADAAPSRTAAPVILDDNA